MNGMVTIANWLATYWIHSSLALGCAWLVDLALRRRLRLVDAAWRFALCAGLVTATLQLLLGIQPLGGRHPLPGTAPHRPPAIARRAAARLQPGLHSAAAVPVEGVAVLGSLMPSGPALAAPVAQSPTTPASLQAAPDLVPEARGPLTATHPHVRLELPAAPVRPEVPATPRWVRLFVVGWLLGGALGLAGLLRSWLRCGRMLGGRQELRDGPTRAALSGLERVSGRRSPVRLTHSAAVEVPLALGILRPEICVPARALGELGRERIDALLAHELAHLMRRDPSWLLLSSVVSRLFFLQPLNWLAARRLATCAELASDDLAAAWTSRPLALAHCLADVAGWLVEPARLVRAAAMAGSRSLLRRRIERLLAAPRRRPELLPSWFPTAAVLTVSAALLTAPSCASLSEGSGEPEHPQSEVMTAAAGPQAPQPQPAAPHRSRCCGDPSPAPVVVVAPRVRVRVRPHVRPMVIKVHVDQNEDADDDDAQDANCAFAGMAAARAEAEAGADADDADDADDESDDADNENENENDALESALEELPQQIAEAAQAVEQANQALSAEGLAEIEKNVEHALADARRWRPSQAERAQLREQVRRATAEARRAMEQARRNLPQRVELERARESIRQAVEQARKSVAQQSGERERLQQEMRRVGEEMERSRREMHRLQNELRRLPATP
jgi:beta-lactamase regulating signal transducer with metallopeptidase domain